MLPAVSLHSRRIKREKEKNYGKRAYGDKNNRDKRGKL